MSSINGITGGSNPQAYAVYTGSTGSAPATPSTAAATPGASEGGGSTSGVGGHRHHHRPAGGAGAGNFQKIADAVTTALQSAKSDPSADPNKTIEDAIASVFKDSAPPAASGANDASPDGTSGTDPSQRASNSPAGAPSRAAFFDTLKSYGIDPKQFHQDLLAAVQDARGGSTDTSAAFKNVPPGVAVDTDA